MKPLPVHVGKRSCYIWYENDKKLSLFEKNISGTYDRIGNAYGKTKSQALVYAKIESEGKKLRGK